MQVSLRTMSSEHRLPSSPLAPANESGAPADALATSLDVLSRNAYVLGSREQEVMRLLWLTGDASVQQVADKLSSSLAYTTVMTILDRLFKKGLLRRKKKERAFVYAPAITASQLERDRAAYLINHFLSNSGAQPEILLSSLVDAVDRYDTTLLDQLEQKIRATRERIDNDTDRKEP
jgi:predicted transcriptional regulator